MIYESKQAAKEAADKFALDKFNKGYWVKKHDGIIGEIAIKWSTSPGNYTSSYSFCFTPLQDIAKDTPVWVRDNEMQKWQCRHTTGAFTEDGEIFCYNAGCTSFTIEYADVFPEPVSWKHYSLTDPTK